MARSVLANYAARRRGASTLIRREMLAKAFSNESSASSQSGSVTYQWISPQLGEFFVGGISSRHDDVLAAHHLIQVPEFMVREVPSVAEGDIHGPRVMSLAGCVPADVYGMELARCHRVVASCDLALFREPTNSTLRAARSPSGSRPSKSPAASRK